MAKQPKKPAPRKLTRHAVEAKARADALPGQVWLLREDGGTYRQIAKVLGISCQRVCEVIYADPGRLELYRAQAREERATLWKTQETSALEAFQKIQKAASGILYDAAGEPIKEAIAEHGPRWAAIFRQSANDAGRQVALLSGDPTERIDASEAPPEDLPQRREALIEGCIKADALECLPPEYLAEALRRIQARQKAAA